MNGIQPLGLVKHAQIHRPFHRGRQRILEVQSLHPSGTRELMQAVSAGWGWCKPFSIQNQAHRALGGEGDVYELRGLIT
jgi:hypothetical protein